MSDPIEVLLQFAFLGVLYLFLLWVARSALRDLGRPATGPVRPPTTSRRERARPYSGAAGGASAAAGLASGQAFGVGPGLVIGRALASEIRSRTRTRPGGTRACTTVTAMCTSRT